jgi:hypothetical protein
MAAGGGLQAFFRYIARLVGLYRQIESVFLHLAVSPAASVRPLHTSWALRLSGVRRPFSSVSL